MKYQHILSALLGEVWAIDPAKGALIAAFIADQVSGIKYTAEDIQARIGSPDLQARAQAAQFGTVRLADGGSAAVVPLHGIISHRGGIDASSELLASVTEFVGSLSAAMADEQVSHVIMDLDSPGGGIAGVPEAYQAIVAMRETKPIAALVNTMAGSAAYWLASAATEIVSTPSGMAGSIGVYTMHESIAGMLEQKGIEAEYIFAGKHKVDGNPLGPLSDEARAHIQAEVDDAYNLFVADVAAGRGTSGDAVRSGYGQGRALNARAALAAGLVDRIETSSQLLQRIGASAPPARQQSRFSGMSATDWANRHRYA